MTLNCQAADHRASIRRTKGRTEEEESVLSHLVQEMKEERKEEWRRKNPSFITLFLQTLTNQDLDQASLPGWQDALTAVGPDGVKEDQTVTVPLVSQ
jgi:hypothetical protein